MARITLMPLASYPFSTQMTVRVSDLNYGNHLSNHKILAFAHEARVRYLASIGQTELDFGGKGLIMADAAIVFRQQAFLGDDLVIEIGIAEISRSSFEIHYRISNQHTHAIIALVKTAMVCYDYSRNKVVSIPPNTI